VLVQATPAIVAERSQALVLFAGEGELLDKVKAEALALCPKDRVRFLGFRQDIDRLLDGCDVFVMCSVMEGLCTSILDALARRRPVVASEVGGMPEIVEEGATGRLVPPRDPAALARAVVDLLTDRQQAERLALAGRERVESRFSVDAMVEGTLGVYRDVLRGDTGGRVVKAELQSIP
jgi:glycosyltransferase involved in cell wall biosynthesis